jgi:hypothetical protein
MEIDRADDRPMGRFAWTNHIYFEISPAVVPLHLCTTRGRGGCMRCLRNATVKYQAYIMAMEKK